MYLDYLYFSRKLIIQLLNRGYEFSKLAALAHSIGNIDRKSLLPYKAKNTFKTVDNVIFFGLEFNKQIDMFSCLVSNAFESILKQNSLLNKYKLKTFFSMASNIVSIFVHNRSIHKYSIKYTMKCKSTNCMTCNFVDSNSYVLLKNNFIIPINKVCDCTSKNIVYIIKCSLCNQFYVGQSSKSVHVRLKQHIKAIKKFFPYVNYTNEVGYHFNLKGHNYEKNLKFFVFKNDLKKSKNRLSVETDLIHIIETFNPPIINKIKPSIYKINTFAFL